jgi:hypothetical protein
VQTRAGNGRPMESYLVGRSDASTFFLMSCSPFSSTCDDTNASLLTLHNAPLTKTYCHI